MAYRICMFSAEGRIISILPGSYNAKDVVVPGIVATNPGLYGFVDESLLPTLDIPDAQENYGVYETTADGVETFLVNVPNRSALYDPRAEVTLFIPNPQGLITRNTRLVQDITKTAIVNNPLDASTQPVHSTTQKKFGLASGKFTRSLSGYTGGHVRVTNLSKIDQGVYVAPHNNIAGTALNSYSMELFFYPTSFSNNFTLLQKGAAGASANWKLGFDSSAGFLQFAWKSLTGTAGYNYSQNIINTAGMTTNSWQHVAVSVVRNTGTAGTISYLVSGYYNGALAFNVGVTAASAPETRYDQPLFIGNNTLGNESFDGYIDAVRVLESGNTAGVFGPSGYGFLPYGSGTLGVPTLAGFTNNSEVAFIMNFNGLNGSTAFYAQSRDHIAATATRITDLILGASGAIPATSIELGVRDVVRYTLGYVGATGYSDPTGFSMNYGPITVPFISTGTADGYDYAFPLNGIYDNQPNLNVYRINYRNDIAFDRSLELMTQIEGAYGNLGSSGSVFDSRLGQNPFRRLFSNGGGNSYGLSLAHNSLFLDPINSGVMSYIMENGYLVTQGISGSSYSFTDAVGVNRYLTATDISNLRLDILEYQSNLNKAAKTAIAEIDSSATINEVKFAKIKKASGYAEAAVSGEETLG